MKKILFITTTMTRKTARGSISETALKKYREIYLKKFPENEVKWLDLSEEKELREVMNSDNFDTFFNDSDKYIDLLKSVDNIVIATPMTNFSYSCLMKMFFDKICVAGKTFKYKYDGNGESEGLLTNLEVQIIAVQGATEGWYTFSNFIPAMEGTWKFLGAKVKKTIQIHGVNTKAKRHLSAVEIVDTYIDQITKSI